MNQKQVEHISQLFAQMEVKVADHPSTLPSVRVASTATLLLSPHTIIDQELTSKETAELLALNPLAYLRQMMYQELAKVQEGTQYHEIFNIESIVAALCILRHCTEDKAIIAKLVYCAMFEDKPDFAKHLATSH